LQENRSTTSSIQFEFNTRLCCSLLGCPLRDARGGRDEDPSGGREEPTLGATCGGITAVGESDMVAAADNMNRGFSRGSSALIASFRSWEKLSSFPRAFGAPSAATGLD